MTERTLIRGFLLGAMAAALSGCYGGYEEPTAPPAYSYGYGYQSTYPAYDGPYYYAPYDNGQEGQADLGPRGGKGL